jgi:LemA protein
VTNSHQETQKPAAPDLKASANFAQLSTQMVEIEDVLQYLRRSYNGAVRDLNFAVESFPLNLVAGWFGFRPADYSEVEAAVEQAAPQISIWGSRAESQEDSG